MSIESMEYEREIDVLRAQLAERDATIAVMREALEIVVRQVPCRGLKKHGCPLCAAELALSSDAGKRHAERVAALEAVAEAARDAEYRSDDDREPVRAAIEALDALEAKT